MSHIETLREPGPPMPLTRIEANEQVIRLRRLYPAYSSTTIARIIDAYHGVPLKRHQVDYILDLAGLPRKTVSATRRAHLDRIRPLGHQARRARSQEAQTA